MIISSQFLILNTQTINMYKIYLGNGQNSYFSQQSCHSPLQKAFSSFNCYRFKISLFFSRKIFKCKRDSHHLTAIAWWWCVESLPKAENKIINLSLWLGKSFLISRGSKWIKNRSNQRPQNHLISLTNRLIFSDSLKNDLIES